MQTTTDSLSTTQAVVSQDEAQRIADTYLLTTVSPSLESTSPILVPSTPPTWRMLIRLRQQEPTATVGTIEVDAQTSKVLPLTAEQVEDVRDRLNEHTGQVKGILRPTAQIRANGYLTNYVSLFAKADRPVWVEGNRPVWRTTVFLRVRGQGRVCDLGTLDVDAETGEVIPLSNQHLQAMRKRAQDAAGRTALATAPTR